MNLQEIGDILSEFWNNEDKNYNREGAFLGNQSDNCNKSFNIESSDVKKYRATKRTVFLCIIYKNECACGFFLYGPPSNVFFSTSAYFVNGNTYLMSYLTDISFYPSAERIWLCKRLKLGCDRLTEDADFGKKKSYFQVKLILILVGM